ncbi:histidine phosphatase family protein [Pseudomonas sp.]|uniref:histidine phosphatase family protein n=1 Tax=Pseudomonas sp. TaxID=306 RepID=UPI002B5D612D|nr:histidine phosphatase family protein [Pseudomonas sp.]HUE94721.1 histidine phosphatase family protein [Pseudomonas sp.]
MTSGAAPRPRRRIYLMRHAEVSYFDAQGQPLDPRQVPLTERGRQQAAAAGALLAEVSFDLAVCSGLPRTEETARQILHGRALPLHAEPRLQEIRGGRLREIPRQDRERSIAYAYDGAEQPGARFIGGELWSDFVVRVNQAWAQLIARDDWQNLLIVAHDAVNRLLLAQIIGCGLGGLKGFEQDPACINIIEADIDAATIQRAFIRTLNLTAYDLIRPCQQLTVMEKVWRDYRSS